MISEKDIEDWDKESQQAYLKWASDYGISYEPYLGQPDIYAAWKAARDWTAKQMSLKIFELENRSQPKREWVDLTPNEKDEAEHIGRVRGRLFGYQYIVDKLKEKNGSTN